MFDDYIKLVRDCIAHFQDEWKLAPTPPCTFQKHTEVAEKKIQALSPPKELTRQSQIDVKPPERARLSSVGKAEEGDRLTKNERTTKITHPAESPSQIRQLLQKCAPTLRLREATLDDASATRIMQAWQEYVGDADVILLAASRDPETLELIKNLAKNIAQKKLGNVKALSIERLEREKRWDLFLSKNRPKLLIASLELMQMHSAMSFYKQNTATAEATLGGISLLVLCAPATYAKQEKIALWNTLCRFLKS